MKKFLTAGGAEGNRADHSGDPFEQEVLLLYPDTFAFCVLMTAGSASSSLA